jgi:hypothetical protein
MRFFVAVFAEHSLEQLDLAARRHVAALDGQQRLLRPDLLVRAQTLMLLNVREQRVKAALVEVLEAVELQLRKLAAEFLERRLVALCMVRRPSLLLRLRLGELRGGRAPAGTAAPASLPSTFETARSSAPPALMGNGPMPAFTCPTLTPSPGS